MAKGKVNSVSLGQSWYNDDYTDALEEALSDSIQEVSDSVDEVAADVEQLKQLGSQTVPGSFADWASVPDNASGYTVAPTVNDFVYVGEDETQDGAMTLYTITSVAQNGDLEYEFVHKVSTDLSNKIDRVDGDDITHTIPTITNNGNLESSGLTLDDLKDEILNDLTFTPIA